MGFSTFSIFSPLFEFPVFLFYFFLFLWAFENMADVKSGCLYGGSLIRTPASRFKGVQVFTYKELEMATDKFSEANVIGNGGFGVVYRGVLSDGTVAAIKVLRRDGKQGERAFRIEVSDFIYCFCFYSLLSYPLPFLFSVSSKQSRACIIKTRQEVFL